MRHSFCAVSSSRPQLDDPANYSWNLNQRRWPAVGLFRAATRDAAMHLWGLNAAMEHQLIRFVPDDDLCRARVEATSARCPPAAA
jgi:hypothetical protein